MNLLEMAKPPVVNPESVVANPNQIMVIRYAGSLSLHANLPTVISTGSDDNRAFTARECIKTWERIEITASYIHKTRERRSVIGQVIVNVVHEQRYDHIALSSHSGSYISEMSFSRI